MKAIALVSGGLDSTLAARIVKDQGVEIIILNFKTPFCMCDKKSSSGGGCHNESAKVAASLGAELKVIYVAEDFLALLKGPKHGFGSNMNPCIDCRILLYRKAKEVMQEMGASFVISGEVLGQRPMSQHRRALGVIEKESGLEGLILRPLSAKLLVETIPEKMGWVKREKLLALNGRSRRPQMDMAALFEIKDYPCSAGGCLLTDPEFSRRLKDLMSFEELTINNVELLKLGRHFKMRPDTKLIVGRNESENARLQLLAREKDYLFMTKESAGPAALGRGDFNHELIQACGEIISRYCDLEGAPAVNIYYRRLPDKESRVMQSAPTDEARLASLRV